jgi:cytochrome c oxidase assembly protein subunit 15
MRKSDASLATAGVALMRRGLDRFATPTIVRRLAVVTAAVMFVVYALGTLVTTSGSGKGCGNSWPLCRGRFIPEFAISTAIEFTHRIATSVVSILVLATAVGVLWLWRNRLELRILAPLTVVALLAEAGLGAALVLSPQTPWLLAVHFGTSLILFSSTLFVALIVSEFGSWDALRDRPVPSGFRLLAFGLAVYTYVVGYLGAYMRLRGDELACQGWPLCNGQVIPGFAGAVGIAFTHRVAAFVLLLGTAALFFWARNMRRARPDLYRGSLWAIAVVVTQVFVGGIVALTRVAQLSQLAHSGLVALLFGALAYICLHTLPRPADVRKQRRTAPSEQPASHTPASVQRG